MRKVLRLIKVSHSVKAYKDSGCWYVKDLNGFSKADNQFVLGVPELIERLSPNSTLVGIKYSEKPFKGSLRVGLIHSDFVGSTYEYEFNNSLENFWLCPVFFWYFPKAPGVLYVSIKKLA
jgi:hypothetical protein